MLATHTPSAIGPTPNYFVSIYFGRNIFADLLKERFSELIESRLFEMRWILCVLTKTEADCSSYAQLMSFCYNKVSRLNLIRKFVNIVYEAMSGYLLLN